MKTIKKNKLKDELRNAIQTAILAGELKPGDRIVETRLAADMGVSQAPVREALKELEHAGLIESKPYQGTYVKQLSKKELSDAYDARLILELHAVGAAAEKITPEQLLTVQELMEKMNTAAQGGDVQAFIDYDVDFHQAIIDSGDNEMIGRLWRLANISLWTCVTTNLSERSLENLAYRHNAVYETLSRHDVAGAQSAMRIHLLELKEEMLERMEE